MIAKKLIDVAAYLRMSSDKQDTSIADQRKEITEYAAKRGYRIVRWYEDEGISGWKSKERHGFQKLIADAADGDFRGVLCWDQSRFSRFTPMEANHYWFMLQQADVWIETIKEGRLDFETLGGWLSASVNQHGRAEYCKSLAFDVVRGRRNQVLKGRWITCPPFGYRINSTTGKLELGPVEEIEVVRRIFQLRAEGLGRRLIAMRLIAEGAIGPKRGKFWKASQIWAMLSRETYLGHMVVGRKKTGKFTHITDEIIRFDNAHPAIIDQDLWDKVQEVNKNRKFRISGKRRPQSGHLSGLLRCGQCGGPMYIDRRVGNYVCGTYHSGHGCDSNAIKSDRAVEVVCDVIRQHVLMGSLENATARIEKILAKRSRAQTGPTADSIKKQIAEIDRKLEAAAERLLEVEPALVPSVRKAMLGLQDKRKGLEEKLADVQPAKKPLTAKQIAGELWRLDTVLQKGEATEFRAAIVRLIDKVVIEFTRRPVGSGKRTYGSVAAAVVYFSTQDCNNQSRTAGP